MVFEQVFANILNTYLSEFIDDVNASQLQLGAWKGKLELKNLSLKEHALDSLDLPFRISHGKIGLLSASIPWSSLYTSPVVVKLSNVLAVAVPNVTSAYDEEKEAAAAEAAKQKALQKLEEAIKLSAQKESSVDPSKTGGDDFVSKLTAQIVKNLQIRIDNVHIRFEDNFTNPIEPYVAGITLDQMLFETEQNHKHAKYSSAKSDDVIYKLVLLQNLSVYWNVISVAQESRVFLSQSTPQDTNPDDVLINCIASRARQPTHLDYLLRPITFRANAMINRKPQVDDFSVPVLDLDLSLDDFKIGFTTSQFESFLQLLDNLSRMRLAFPHRKLRPTVPVTSNAKIWWKFAIAAITEHEVKRKNRHWSWRYIKQHRESLKQYISIYKRKLLNPKDELLAKQASEFEKSLDVFNIVLARRQAEADVAEQLKKMKAEKSPEKKKASKGWFSGWWGSSNEEATEEDTQTDSSNNGNVMDNLKREMTPEEKAKLYAAIGYDANSTIAIDYPGTFEAHLLSVLIRSIKLVIIDTSRNKRLIEIALVDVISSIRHRPSSRGWHLTSSVDDLAIYGLEDRPLVQEETEEKAFLFDFIASPIDGSFDFGIKLKTSPLHFIYDPHTVNTLVEIFTKRLHNLTIAQIQAMAQARINRLKRMSASSLEYAVSKHKDLNIDIDFAPFFLIIPSGNIWKESLADAIVCCLGRVQVLSIVEGRRDLNVRQLSKDTSQDKIIELARERAYESYNLSLSEVQMFLTTGSKWKDDIGYKDGSKYEINPSVNPILQPISLNVLFQRCIIDDDPDLPKFKIRAGVPSIALVATDKQLVKTLNILTNIPLPVRSDPGDLSSEVISIGATLDQPDLSGDTFMNLAAIDTVDSVEKVEAKPLAAIDFNIEFRLCAINLEILSENLSILKASGSASDETLDLIYFSIVTKEVTDGMETVSVLEMKGFTLIFALDYLMKIYSDFNEIIASNAVEPANSETLALPAPPQAQKSIQPPTQGSESVLPSSKTMLKAAKRQSSLSFQFRMSKIDLVLIEADTTSDIPAVIFNNFLEIEMIKRNDQFNIVAKIAQNQLSMTNLTKYLKNNEVEAKILSPADFSFVFNLNTETNVKKLDVSIDHICLNISPNTVHVLLSLLSSVASNKAVAQVGEKASDSIVTAESLVTPAKWKDKQHWFLLKPCSEAMEVTEDTILTPDSMHSITESISETLDQCILSIPSVKVVLESGGAHSRPLITFETSLVGQLTAWKAFRMSTTLCMSYYNEKLHVWEPVIELTGPERPWSLLVHGDLAEGDRPMRVCSESTDRLELTASKTFLSVATRLGEAFGKAVKKSERLRKQTDIIRVTNLTGVDVDILASEYKYELSTYPVVTQKGDYFRCITTKSGEEKVLVCKASLKAEQFDSSDFILRFTYSDISVLRSVPLSSQYQRLFHVPTSPSCWLIHVEIPEFGVKKVTIGTSVELVNHLKHGVEVYCINEDSEAQLVTSIHANSRSFLPLNAIYVQSDLIFFNVSERCKNVAACEVEYEYCIPNRGIDWKNPNNHEKAIFVKCEPNVPVDPTISVPSANMVIVSSNTQVLRDDSSFCTSITTIEINPTLVFQNLLPFEVKYQLILCKPISLAPGESAQLIHMDPDQPLLTIEIPNYLGSAWHCSRVLPIRNFSGDDVLVWSFNSVNNDPVVSLSNPPKPRVLHLNISVVKNSPKKPIVAQIFAPFWFINKIGMPVSYKSSDQLWHHESGMVDPIVFSFRPGKLWKQKIHLQCGNSHWSDGFPIDAIGNQGNIVCLDKDKVAKCISVESTLSSFSLTKIITFSPFYTIVNRTDTEVDISDTGSTWARVLGATRTSFWPRVTKDGVFYLRCKDPNTGYNQISPSISFRESNSSLVALGDLLFNVLVDVTDSGITIQLSDYDEGSCPVKIFNHTSLPMKYGQQGVGNFKTLYPGYSVYYLWDKPSDEQILTWELQGKEAQSHTINEDTCSANPSKEYFWVSFLDGRQRTLLISEDSELTQAALQTNELTKPKIELEMTLKGMGLSIVNDEIQKDLIYLGVSGSDTIWEVKKIKSKRYKPLQRNQIDVIEAAYQSEVLRRKIAQSQSNSPVRESYVQALAHRVKVDLRDLNSIAILEPVKGFLRRYSAPGLWIHLSQSEHIFKAHLKISRVQVDNQMDNCLFGIIMCPVTPPKSLAQDRAPKSFIEMSLLRQQTANINRYKLLSILIQEFLVQVDGAFLLALSDFLGQSSTTGELNYKKLISTDLNRLRRSEDINDEHEVILSKAYFDCVHFSPIKLHLSFSLGGIPSFQLFGVLNLLLRSAGVTLTEFKDVVLRIDFFERKNIFLDRDELISSAVSHYINQVLRQFYVIVLGLDVIGNPVGLVMGLRQGVGDFFYEPFLGIIEGPEEFAEGLVFGVKSLFSNTVGGAAGALSKITGTLGEGVSALTMDDEFIRRRRIRLQRPQNVAENSKELAQGFWRGLSGIIRKPIEGARDDGIEGLFKGIGKGAVGIIAQPATGVIDFASGSMGLIKKAVDINQEAKKQRPSRFFKEDAILYPYDLHEAKGNQMLVSLDKGSYSKTDTYIAHCVVRHPANNAKEEIVLITTLRILVLRDSCMFSTHEVDWTQEFKDILDIELYNINVIRITLKESRRRLCVIDEGPERLIYCQSGEVAQWLISRMRQAPRFQSM